MTFVHRALLQGPRIGGRRLPPLPVAALIVAVIVANTWYLGWTIRELATDDLAFDWEMLVESGRRVRAGEGLYTHDPYYLFAWSPIAAWIFSVLAPIGMWGWRLLHFAAVLLIPDRRLQLLVLLSWPFWVDVEAGNILVFVFVSALWALRGNTIGVAAFFALTFLAPRPLQLPIAVWLLVARPETRLPAVALTVIAAGLVAWSGWGPDWVSSIIESRPRELENDMNVGPSQLIGAAWVPVGLLLGIWLTIRDRLGWASLAVSPYWLPMYLLMGFLEFDRRRLWADVGRSTAEAREGRVRTPGDPA